MKLLIIGLLLLSHAAVFAVGVCLGVGHVLDNMAANYQRVLAKWELHRKQLQTEEVRNQEE